MATNSSDTGRDWLGNEVKVGDLIVYMDTKYKKFNKGVVEKITPEGFTIAETKKHRYSMALNRNWRMVISINAFKEGALENE